MGGELSLIGLPAGAEAGMPTPEPGEEGVGIAFGISAEEAVMAGEEHNYELCCGGWMERKGRGSTGGIVLDDAEGRDVEFGILAEETGGVVVEDVEGFLLGVVSSAELEDAIEECEGGTGSPVGGGIDHDSGGAESFEDIDGAACGHFGDGVEGESCPVTGVEDGLDGVFFGVVDPGAMWGEFHFAEEIEGESSAFEFIAEVWGVDEDDLVVAEGDVELFLEDGEFVGGVEVEADFADADDGGFAEEMGDLGEDFAAEGEVVGLFGVHGDPAEMADAVLSGAGGFELADLVEVVEEGAGVLAVETRPEGGLGDGDDAGHGHAFVVVGGSSDGVVMGLDDVHNDLMRCFGSEFGSGIEA